MRRFGEIVFLVFLSTLFILNPVLSFGAEKKQESVTINEQDMQKYLQTFKGVIEKYMDELEKQGIEIDRERVEKDLNNLLQFGGPLELNEKVLNEYLEKNINKMNEMINNIMSKDPAQLRENLAGGTGAVSNGPTNEGAPGQIDYVMNMAGRVLGGVFEGIVLGFPGTVALFTSLGLAIGLALDAGVSMAVILGCAALAGLIVGVIFALLSIFVLAFIGTFLGAIIGALILAAIVAIIIGIIVSLLVAIMIISILTFMFIIPIFIFLLALVALIIVLLISPFAMLLSIIVGGIGGAVVGGVGGGMAGFVLSPFTFIMGGISGGIIGGLAGSGLSLVGQVLFVPIILLLGSIGFVLGTIIGGIGAPLIGGVMGLLNSAGMKTASAVMKSVESYNNDDFIYNIDKIIMNALNEAKKALGPKAYNKIKQIEIIIDTADLTTQEGIVKATEEILNLAPIFAQ
jgi:uncharacterized protein (UPF0297 family)